MPYQVVLPFNQFPPIADASVATVDMANLQRPTKKRDSLTDSLESNLFRVERQMQLFIEKPPDVHYTLCQKCSALMNQYTIIDISSIETDAQIVLDVMIKWREIEISKHLTGEVADRKATPL